jgi:hypothetical protein
MRTASLIMVSGLFVQVAHADDFPNGMLGTWAETSEQCAAKTKLTSWSSLPNIATSKAGRWPARAYGAEIRLASIRDGGSH